MTDTKLTQKSGDLLEIEGHLYDGFYIVRNVDIHAGFSALILYVLNGIRKAQEMNSIPVVDLNKENTPHFYDAQYGANIWNYYFSPINSFSYQEVMGLLDDGVITTNQVYLPSSEEVMNAHHIEENRLATFWAWNIPTNKVEWMSKKRQLGRRFVHQYLQPKTAIVQKVCEFATAHFENHYMIGVHIRGTDFAYAQPTPIENYLKEIDQLLHQRGAASYQIFVATDQQQYIDIFKERYREKVFYRNAIRSVNHIAPFRLDNVNAYQKGEDVLIDILLLSRCQYLLKGAAATGELALWFNEGLDVTDFALQSEFQDKSYDQLETTFSQLNIGQKSGFGLRVHRFRAKVIRKVQGSLIGSILFRRSKFIRKLLRH